MVRARYPSLDNTGYKLSLHIALMVRACYSSLDNNSHQVRLHIDVIVRALYPFWLILVTM